MKSFAWVIILLAFAALASAPLPEPHGVAGKVYHNMSTSQVSQGTPFKVNDTTTGSFFQDWTGIGPYSGAYSVVVDGSDGDYVIISAWNISRYGRRNITLSGDMAAIDVYLNNSRSSEANLTILWPVNNSVYNISTGFNLTANISMLGANGANCYATISLSNATVIYLNDTATHSLGAISLGNSVTTFWRLTGNYTGWSNLTVNASCGSDGEYFDFTGRSRASNVTIVDAVAPVVRLMSPPNNTVNNTHNTIFFFFNVSDSSPVLNCTLIINSTINRTRYNPLRSTALSFNSTIESGNYSWSVNCTDSSLNTGASPTYYLWINVTTLNISSVSLISPINLQPGSVQLVICNASVQGAYRVNATLFSTASAAHSSADNNSIHYTNSSCSLINGNYSCGFYLWYYAENATWMCNVTATSAQGNTTWLNASAQINTLLSMNISPDVMNFGIVIPNNATSLLKVNITNTGNIPLDLQLYGYGGSLDDGHAMNCTYTFIPIENQHYGFNRSANFTNMTPLSGNSASPSFLNVSIPKRTSAIPWNATYWSVFPPMMVPQNCTGSVVFNAIIDS